MSKRLFDLVLAAAGLVVLAPLLAFLALLVRLSGPGPALYRARRVGRNGVLFDVFKFRTMRIGASGPAITASGDPRVTNIGRVLRRTKLDELPQLFNVVRGEMSLVGPRPEDPRYVALYDTEQRSVLSVRPGITSAASLRYRDEESRLTGEQWEEVYVREVMPAKLAIDLEYLDRATLLSDIRLILRTVGAMFRR